MFGRVRASVRLWCEREEEQAPTGAGPKLLAGWKALWGCSDAPRQALLSPSPQHDIALLPAYPALRLP